MMPLRKTIAAFLLKLARVLENELWAICLFAVVDVWAGCLLIPVAIQILQPWHRGHGNPARNWQILSSKRYEGSLWEACL